MADTKKPNFAEALKAQAKPAATSSADESVVVDLGDGQPTTLYRGKGSTRMDDAQWARLKQRAVKVIPNSVERPGTPSEAELAAGRAPNEADLRQKESSMEAANSRRQALLDLVNNPHFQPGKDSIVPDKDTLDIVRKMKPSDQADYLEKRIQHQEWQQQQEVDRSKKMSEKDQPVEKDLGVQKPDQGTPDEWKPPFTPPGSQGLQTEDDVKLGMGANPRNPASMIPQLAMGAIDPNGKSPTGDPNADKYTQAAIDKGNATGEADAKFLQENIPQPVDFVKDQVDRRVFGGESIVPDEVKQLPQAVGAGMATDLGTIGQIAGNALGMPNLARGAANLSNRAQKPPAYTDKVPVSPTDQNAKPLPVPMKNPDTQPLGNPGGSGSASMSMKMPSGFKVEQVDPALQKQYDADRLAQKGLIADAQDTLAAGEIVKDGLVRSAAERERTVQADAAKFAQLATQARLDSIEEARGYQTRKLALAKQAQEAAATPTDPNRFWNNKTDGQKAAAVIAGALFGFSGQGQGMQWLQRIDGLVNADNQLQAQDRASKVQGLQQEAETLGEAGRQAMAQGASRAEAFLIDRNTKLEGLKSFLDMTVMKTNNMDAKMRGAQMSMQLGDMIVKNDQDALALGQQRADKKTEWNYRNAELGMKAFAISAKAGAAGKGGLKFSPGEVAKMDAARQGFDAVDTLKKALGPEQGLGAAMYDEVTKRGGQLTEAGRRQKGVEPQRRALIKLIDDSVINKTDAEYWKDKISNVGLDNMSQADLDGLKKYFTALNNSIVTTRQNIGEPMEAIPEEVQ